MIHNMKPYFYLRPETRIPLPRFWLLCPLEFPEYYQDRLETVNIASKGQILVTKKSTTCHLLRIPLRTGPSPILEPSTCSTQSRYTSNTLRIFQFSIVESGNCSPLAIFWNNWCDIPNLVCGYLNRGLTALAAQFSRSTVASCVVHVGNKACTMDTFGGQIHPFQRASFPSPREFSLI